MLRLFKSSGVRTLTAVVHVEADVHISNESIHVQHAPPAPLAAAPHAERVRGSIAIGLSGLGLYEDAQCRRETTVRIICHQTGVATAR